MLRQVKWFDTESLTKPPDLASEDRKKLRGALNTMKALLLMNDAMLGQISQLQDEPSLLLAEHQAGSYLVTNSINDLRLEDAVRYLWLSSLELSAWNAKLSEYREAIENGESRASIADDLERVASMATTPEKRRTRETAYKAWVQWVRSTMGDVEGQVSDIQERRRRASLTLAQTSELNRSKFGGG